MSCVTPALRVPTVGSRKCKGVCDRQLQSSGCTISCDPCTYIGDGVPCDKVRCTRLKVVVISPAPWTPAPAAPSTGGCDGDGAPLPYNCSGIRCQTPLTAGVPWRDVRIGGRPSAIPTADIPAAVVRDFPAYVKCMRALAFDFATTTSAEGERNTGVGSVDAVAACGKVQASVSFKYRYCCPRTCRGIPLPAFEITSCMSRNAKLSLVTSYVPTDGCTEGVVVFALAQCCRGCLGNECVAVPTPDPEPEGCPTIDESPCCAPCPSLPTTVVKALTMRAPAS